MKLINIVIYILIISIILILLYDYFKEENKVQIQDNPNVEGFYIPSKFGKIKNVQKNIDNVYFYAPSPTILNKFFRIKKQSTFTLYSFFEPEPAQDIFIKRENTVIDFNAQQNQEVDLAAMNRNQLITHVQSKGYYADDGTMLPLRDKFIFCHLT